MRALITIFILNWLVAGCAVNRKEFVPRSSGASADKQSVSKRLEDTVSITLVKRIETKDDSFGLFRITNNTSRTVSFSNYFLEEFSPEFSPMAVKYEIWRNGKWVNVPYSISAIPYAYELPPGRTLTTRIWLGRFETGNVQDGDLVRILLDEYPSKAFRW